MKRLLKLGLVPVEDLGLFGFTGEVRALGHRGNRGGVFGRRGERLQGGLAPVRRLSGARQKTHSNQRGGAALAPLKALNPRIYQHQILAQMV